MTQLTLFLHSIIVHERMGLKGRHCITQIRKAESHHIAHARRREQEATAQRRYDYATKLAGKVGRSCPILTPFTYASIESER